MPGSSLLFSGRLLYAMPIAVLLLLALCAILHRRRGNFRFSGPSRTAYIVAAATLLVATALVAVRLLYPQTGRDVELVSMSRMMAAFQTANVMVESRRIGGAVLPLTLGLGSEPPLFPFVMQAVPSETLLAIAGPASEVFALWLFLAALLACRNAKRQRTPPSLTFACFALACLCLARLEAVVPAIFLCAWLLRGRRDWVYEAVRREVLWLGLLFVCLLPMLDMYRRVVTMPAPAALDFETYRESRAALEKYPPANAIVVSAHPAAFGILRYSSLSFDTFLKDWEAMVGSLGAELHVVVFQELNAGKPLPGQELEGVPVRVVAESEKLRVLELGF